MPVGKVAAGATSIVNQEALKDFSPKAQGKLFGRSVEHVAGEGSIKGGALERHNVLLPTDEGSVFTDEGEGAGVSEEALAAIDAFGEKVLFGSGDKFLEEIFVSQPELRVLLGTEDNESLGTLLSFRDVRETLAGGVETMEDLLRLLEDPVAGVVDYCKRCVLSRLEGEKEGILSQGQEIRDKGAEVRGEGGEVRSIGEELTKVESELKSVNGEIKELKRTYDGEMAVKQEAVQKCKKKLKGLAGIPVLGYLFGRRGLKKQQKSLLNEISVISKQYRNEDNKSSLKRNRLGYELDKFQDLHKETKRNMLKSIAVKRLAEESDRAMPFIASHLRAAL